MAQSVFRAFAGLNGPQLELLVIDDGVPATDQLEEIAAQAAAQGISWRYHNKCSRPGLLRSRIEAVALAAGDWILFLDDDVEVEPDYIRRFVDVVRQTPTLVGLGGVDLVDSGQNPGTLFLCLVAGLEPWRLGRISFGGFPAQIARARKARRPFASQRLYGCNMGFRKSALSDMRMLPAFEGYSLYEDAYLSYIASTRGPMLIDPRLQVRHNRSPISRDNSFAVGRMSVINHIELMRARGLWPARAVAILISIVTFVVLFAIRASMPGGNADRSRRNFARGQMAGLRNVLMSKRNSRRSRPVDTAQS